jgi:hypothetical protein
MRCALESAVESAEAIDVLVQYGDACVGSDRHLQRVGVSHVRKDHGRRDLIAIAPALV